MAIKEFINKYIIVQKCTSIAEAEKQAKDRLKILLIAAIFGVVYIVLDIIGITALSGIAMVLAVICLVIGIWTYYKAKAEKRRLDVVLCKECGEKYRMDNVTYRFMSERKSSGTPNNQGIIHFTVVHRYMFDCKCGKCGAERSFESDFIERQGQIRDKIIIQERPVDIEESIRAFFE